MKQVSDQVEDVRKKLIDNSRTVGLLDAFANEIQVIFTYYL